MRLSVVGVMMAVVLPASAQTPRDQAAGAAVPPRWEATKTRVMDLGLESKNQEMVALLEPIVAKYPTFADGLFWYGAAHENLGRDAQRSNPTLAAKHFETAATYGRRAYDLGGGENREALIRGLIDLYDYALPRPETWKALVVDARTRYPAEPVVHWYFAQLLLKEDRSAELPAAFTAARAALPVTPPDARLSFASLLVGLAERTPAVKTRSAFAVEAQAYVDETLKRHPTGSYSRRAQSIKNDLARLK